jgi:NAD(P)-dependent dehydrogenase (short-subunit alcohol dehydrogenase family)
MPSADFSRSVIVAGAASGIGLALAAALVARGDTVVVAGRDWLTAARLARTGNSFRAVAASHALSLRPAPAAAATIAASRSGGKEVALQLDSRPEPGHAWLPGQPGPGMPTARPASPRHLLAPGLAPAACPIEKKS